MLSDRCHADMRGRWKSSNSMSCLVPRLRDPCTSSVHSDATCTTLIWILDKIKLAFERELETFCIHCMFEVMLVLRVD